MRAARFNRQTNGRTTMYQFSYAEVLDETPRGARERERHAIDRSIELLEAAEQGGVADRARRSRPCCSCGGCGEPLVEDLASPENDLPQAPARRSDLDRLVDHARGRADPAREVVQLQGHRRSVGHHPRRPEVNRQRLAARARSIRRRSHGDRCHKQCQQPVDGVGYDSGGGARPTRSTTTRSCNSSSRR